MARAMSEQRALVLRNGLVGSCALLAIVLLASFYSIVSGSVERAARQRLAAGRTAPAVTAVEQSGARGSALLARIGN
jgi:hypothetical protein